MAIGLTLDPPDSSASPPDDRARAGGGRWPVMLAAAALVATVVLFVLLAALPSDGTAVNPDADRVAGLMIDPLGGSNELRSGDLVTAVNGDPIVDRKLPRPFPGRKLTYEVVRGGETDAVDVRLGPYPFGPAMARQWATLVLVGCMLGVALFVYLRRRNEQAARGLLLVAALLTFGSTGWVVPLQVIHSDGGVLWWAGWAAGLSGMMTWPAMLHLAIVLLGVRIPSPRRILALVYTAPLALFLVDGAIRAAAAEHPLARAEAWVPRSRYVEILYTLLIVAVSVHGYRHADEGTRRRARWVVGTFGLAALANLGLWTLPDVLGDGPILSEGAHMLIFVPCPIAIGVAILRVHLFDIDVVIRRSIVFVFLTATIAAIYLGAVGVLSQVFRGPNPWIGLVATGLVAIVFAPIHNQLRKAVSRLIYGERDDPYAVVSLLGERLQATLVPAEIVPKLVATVAEALRLPYVAIEIEQPDGTALIESFGEPSGAALTLPLVYQSDPIGRLVIGERTPGEGFGRRERRMLEGLAGQMGVAVQAARLTLELQRSRERLVAAREEERRRIRHDLHDGLGPSLAATALQLQAASRMALERPEAGAQLLKELAAQVQASIADVRHIVEDLRPPMLDQLGLVGALEEQASRFAVPDENGGGLEASVNGEGDLRRLPAAVEVAAYRIASEALNNAYRHGQARICRVNLRRNESLELEVVDDGIGLSDNRRSGVGLASMRERAEELGGWLTVQARPEGGTAVSAQLPLEGS